jgi:hypothetical protein
MQVALFRAVIALSAVASLTACIGMDGSRHASPAYQPRVALDATKNPQLPADVQDCQKSISQENAKELGSHQYMVLMRGCLIQRGHVLMN